MTDLSLQIPLSWEPPRTGPKIRISAPAAPGSEPSREAADAITPDQMQREMRKVLTWFAAQSEARTRHELAASVYPGDGGIGSACGRVNALKTLGYIEEVGRSGKRSTLRITAKGRAAFKAVEEAA